MSNKFILSSLFIVIFTCSTFCQKLILKYDTDVQVNEASNVRIGVIVINGSDTLKTKGLLKGKFLWRKFKVEVIGGVFFRGDINVTSNQKELKNFSVVVKVTLKKDTSVSAVLNIPFSYSKFKEVDYTPKFILPAAGHWWFLKPTCSSPIDGKAGHDGYSADDRDVYLSVIYDSLAKRSLIQIRIERPNSEDFEVFIIDNLCHFSIVADGNHGRSGWNGSDAKDNKTDGVQKDCPCYSGNGGNGGRGGNGAAITVCYDGILKDQINCLRVSNKGGEGGGGGKAGQLITNYGIDQTVFCNTIKAKDGKDGENGKDGAPVVFVGIKKK